MARFKFKHDIPMLYLQSVLHLCKQERGSVGIAWKVSGDRGTGHHQVLCSILGEAG